MAKVRSIGPCPDCRIWCRLNSREWVDGDDVPHSEVIAVKEALLVLHVPCVERHIVVCSSPASAIADQPISHGTRAIKAGARLGLAPCAAYMCRDTPRLVLGYHRRSDSTRCRHFRSVAARQHQSLIAKHSGGQLANL